MEKKICLGCNKEKPIEEFDKSKGYVSGRVSQCKACKYEYRRLKTERENTMRPLDVCLVEHEREGAEEILQMLGYDVYHPTKTVYTQFKERMQQKGVDISDWE